MTDESVVCIQHGRFIPCRKDGPHNYTANPFWVKQVRDHQNSFYDYSWIAPREGEIGNA